MVKLFKECQVPGATGCILIGGRNLSNVLCSVQSAAVWLRSWFNQPVGSWMCEETLIV